MREKITALIDDIKYQSDNLTDLERLPIIQLKVLLAKINQLTEETAVLTHYVEKRGRLSDIQQEFKSQEKETVIEDTSATIESSEDKPIPEETKSEEADVTSQPDPSREKNVEEKLKRIVVTDLNSAIGINEKYLYSSELFKGSTEELSNAVKVINELHSLSEVQNYIADLAGRFNWDLENQTTLNFIELVERKFDQP